MITFHDAGLFNRASSHYSKAIEEALKELLQNKHLYQSQDVVLPEFNVVYEQSYKSFLAGAVPSPGSTHNPFNFEDNFQIGKTIYWTINDGSNRGSYITNDTEVRAGVDFTPPTVRLYCPHCDNVEPYNYVAGENVLKDLERSEELIHHNIFQDEKEITTESQKKIEQVFMLVYQCQGCKGLPEVFLIRRVGMKLILSGRTPMEKVVVQPYIPKRQRKFFSDAIIAYNAGQILPGIFMLRTFLEQYVRSRSETPLTTNIEALFDEYNASLPEDIKNRFPSLRNIYDRLSEDIHGAIGSGDLFNQAKDDIELHFDARRLFKIPD